MVVMVCETEFLCITYDEEGGKKGGVEEMITSSLWLFQKEERLKWEGNLVVSFCIMKTYV